MPPFVMLVEPTFNILYLLFVWILFAVALRAYPLLEPARKRTAFGFVAALFMLALGDSIHLIPRVYVAFVGLSGRTLETARWLGVGRAASSFTLSFFYLFLMLYVWRKFDLPWTGWMWVLVVACGARLGMLFFPQNAWFVNEYTPWKFYRNIPFAVQGVGVIILFLHYAKRASAETAKLLRGAAYAIVASFAFYMATLVGVLWNPLWGMMMLPKTLAYVAAIWLLYRVEFKSDW